MPPLVIALPEDLDTVSKEYNLSDNELVKYIEKNKKLLLILDGLQRTLTIKDLLNEEKQNNHISDKVNNQKIRIELYVPQAQQYFLASLHCSFLFPDFPFHFAVQSASYHLDQEKRKMTNHISSVFCFSRLQYV